jgi:diguanylate cyclase (GGDEF)-like protein
MKERDFDRGGKLMILREARGVAGSKKIRSVGHAGNKPLALFTESIMCLLTGQNIHGAFNDLVSLMGQTFPLASPALYTDLKGFDKRVYSVLESNDGGGIEALRILGGDSFSYTKVIAGGIAPFNPQRIDLSLLNTPQAHVILSINPGMHEDIFREWAKYLTPAVAKLMDNEALINMAFRDALTGLLNYRAFSQIFEAECERARRYKTTFSLMMIDIDHFKRINDTYGHQAGDSVLSSIARRIQGRVRKSDLVFRYGGEEFMIILPQTGIYKAGLLAERVRAVIEKMRFDGGFSATISIGISQYLDGLTPDDLIKLVDMGLYLAKGKGRNRVEIYYKDI